MQRSSLLTKQVQPARRLFTTRAKLTTTSPFVSGPAPPRLPDQEQRLYEQLQRSSTGAFSTPRPNNVVNQSPAQPWSAEEAKARVPGQINQSPHSAASAVGSKEQRIENINVKVTAQGEGEELHPDVRRGAKPEFEGDRNPKTGEVGGPKTEPLRWGGEVDWSYNGRVTDF